MALFNNFPYSNTEEINLDYTLNKLNELYSRGENLYAELQTWKTSTDEANEAWKSNLLSDINEWQNSVTHSLEEWKTSVDSDVSNALTTLSNQITAELTQAKADLRNEVADLASAAAASAADAVASQSAAAQSAQTAINSAAAAAQSEQNISASAEQIETNKNDIADLRSAIDVENLFDASKATIIEGFIDWDTGIIRQNTSIKTLAYPCKPLTRYIVSKMASTRFYLADCEQNIAVGVTVHNTIRFNESNRISIKTNADSKYLVIMYYNSTADTLTEQEILDSISITYAPTLRENGIMSAVLLDCGRKYFSPANIKRFIDQISYAGGTSLMVYFSDNQGFRLGLDDMSISMGGATYDLSTALGDGITTTSTQGTKRPDGSNKWLTQAEMTDIIRYAHLHDVDIIPVLEMPGHAGAILNAFPQFKMSGSDTTFDLSNSNAVEFAKRIANKYVNYFARQGCRYYHFGGEESSASTSALESFIETLSSQLKKYGITPIIFNSAAQNIADDIIVSYWSSSQGSRLSTFNGNGNRSINTDNTWYWVLGGRKVSMTDIKAADIYAYNGDQITPDPLGACFCIWCDFADTDGTDDGDNVTTATLSRILAFNNAIYSTYFNHQPLL